MGKRKKVEYYVTATLHGEDVDIGLPVDSVSVTGFPGYSDGLGGDGAPFIVVVEGEEEAERFEKAANHPRLKDVIWSTDISRDEMDFLDSHDVGEFEALVAKLA